MDLSILVCSTHTRYDTFLPKISKALFDQFASLTPEDQQRTEILILTDTKSMVLGAKRNALLALASGTYTVFVDDDDRIAADYVSALLGATSTGADCIVFQAEVSLNGGPAKICYYSRDVGRDYNTTEAYYRIPNHICCVKRELALQAQFPEIGVREDSEYAHRLLPLLQSEHKIGRVLYWYDYSDLTTETQGQRPQKSTVDVIILSKADTRATKQMTQRAVDSCVAGAHMPVNVIVIEGGQAAGYRGAVTLHKQEPFNYNRFGNFGASRGRAEWIMLANNDLLFRDGWLQPLLDAGHPLVSPWEPHDRRQEEITENTIGTVTGKHLSGWCFMLRRSLWSQIGGFDTDVSFWCSDDAVIEQCAAVGVEPMIVKASVVEHTASSTLNTVGGIDNGDLTWRNVRIFNEKYGKNKFATSIRYQRWQRLNPVSGNRTGL
jgi:hypothetical protein